MNKKMYIQFAGELIEVKTNALSITGKIVEFMVDGKTFVTNIENIRYE